MSMEQRVAYKTSPDNLLQSPREPATMEPELYVKVPRQSLEMEHRQLISRVQELRRLLGYPPLPTGRELRRQGQE